MLSHEQLKKKMLANRNTKEQYDTLAGEFALIKKFLCARLAAGLSQAQVAKRMGVKVPAVCRIESGQHSPTLRTLTKYAQAVGCRLDLLLTQAAQAKTPAKLEKPVKEKKGKAVVVPIGRKPEKSRAYKIAKVAAAKKTVAKRKTTRTSRKGSQG